MKTKTTPMSTSVVAAQIATLLEATFGGLQQEIVSLSHQLESTQQGARKYRRLCAEHVEELQRLRSLTNIRQEVTQLQADFTQPRQEVVAVAAEPKKAPTGVTFSETAARKTASRYQWRLAEWNQHLLEVCVAGKAISGEVPTAPQITHGCEDGTTPADSAEQFISWMNQTPSAATPAEVVAVHYADREAHAAVRCTDGVMRCLVCMDSSNGWRLRNWHELEATPAGELVEVGA